MSQFSPAERLTLAVRAQLAEVRVCQAMERSALLDRQTAPYLRVCDRFRALYRRDWNADRPADVAAFRQLRRMLGATEVPREILQAASDMHRDIIRLTAEAIQALEVLLEASERDGAMPLQCVGVTEDVLRQAVAEALLAKESHDITTPW